MKLSDLPADQIQRVMNQKYCDIDSEFFGFVEIYEKLAGIIPKHWDVVDLGCAYNPQCWLFRDHKSFHAVDLLTKERFTMPNCTIYEMPIEEFIKKHLDQFDLKTTFAICSYVPPWHGDNVKMAREAFKNVFTYYPHGGTPVDMSKFRRTDVNE